MYYWAAQLRSLKQCTADNPCPWRSVEDIDVIPYDLKYIHLFRPKVLKKKTGNPMILIRIWEDLGGKKQYCQAPLFGVTSPPTFNDTFKSWFLTGIRNLEHVADFL
jgi:hypothetical protein